MKTKNQTHTRTIHVVAWQYAGGAGFDWYKNKADADAAFIEEKKNELELAAEGWTAYTFAAHVPDDADPEEITDLIDANIDERCAAVGPSRESILAKLEAQP